VSVRRVFMSLLAPVGALIFSLLVASIALVLVGFNPLTAFAEMGKFAWSPASLVSISNRAVPLFMSGLAVAIGFKMGLFNIGVEGQYLLAAVFAAYLGAVVNLPPVLHVLFIILVAMIVGALWSGIAGILKVTRGVHEVIATIMLNAIAVGLVAWLLANFFRKVDPGDLNIKTAELPHSAWFPSLNPLLNTLGIPPPPGPTMQGFMLVAIVFGIVFYLLVWRSRYGFELRASGINPDAARMSGVEPGGMVMQTMLLSGALAGLVGLSPLLGYFHRYTQDFPSGLGFTGIAVALLGRNHPVGIFLGALLFGFMDRSALILDLKGIPREIVTIIQGVVVLAVVVAYEVVTRMIQRQEVAAAAEAAKSDAEKAA